MRRGTGELMMNVCEFCHADRDGYVTRLAREGIGHAHIGWSDGGWKLCVSSGKQVRMTVKIKFCPICGRRLEAMKDD